MMSISIIGRGPIDYTDQIRKLVSAELATCAADIHAQAESGAPVRTGKLVRLMVHQSLSENSWIVATTARADAVMGKGALSHRAGMWKEGRIFDLETHRMHMRMGIEPQVRLQGKRRSYAGLGDWTHKHGASGYPYPARQEFDPSMPKHGYFLRAIEANMPRLVSRINDGIRAIFGGRP